MSFKRNLTLFGGSNLDYSSLFNNPALPLLAVSLSKKCEKLTLKKGFNAHITRQSISPTLERTKVGNAIAEFVDASFR